MRTLIFLFPYIKSKKKELLVAFFLMSIISALTLLPAYFIQFVFDKGIMHKNMEVVLKYSAIILAIYIVKSLVSYKSNIRFASISQRIIMTLKEELTSKLLKLPMEFFNFYPSGYLAGRISEIDNIGVIFSTSTFKTILSAFEFIIVFTYLMNINWQLTLLLSILIPFYYFLPRNFLSSVSKSSASIAEGNAKLNARLQQTVQGIEEVKNFNGEDKEKSKILSVMRNLMRLNIKQSISYSIGAELIIFLSSLTTVLLMILGGWAVISNKLTLGQYIVFSSYIPKLYSPVQSLATFSLSVQPALTSIERLRFILGQRNELGVSNKNLEEIKSISFADVSFSYTNLERTKEIIKDLTFEITENQHVKIVGANGSGKTTLLRLILGLYRPTEGAILVNGENINELPQKLLRKKIGIVSQKIYLFSGTVEENIKYGVDCIDSVFFEKLMKELNLLEFFKGLPEGLSTFVGENGENLSGGQIQKIAIARALLKKPDVVLFDEATAHMDINSRDNLESYVNNNLKNTICIFITHNVKDFEKGISQNIFLEK
ncbi:ABC transporter ATP-binding protein/permease [Lactococcus lactis]|uniref:ABC transporter ATP-binding protein/permease n=1 Tax=Lactococcus lactis TaxID=1358 RepID=A0A9X4S5X3_9LACT|nr:ABC transporter ATP-binding protein [Lactococcus lactis]MDG4983781.1 ABC transporter ATP-binding protein/permease [Lactococcus lactis]